MSDLPQKLADAIEWAMSRVRHRPGDVPMGYVYVFRGGSEYFKIGVAKNVERRLGSLQNGCPFPLEVALIIPHRRPYALESTIHARLAEHRTVREWFVLKSSEGEPALAERNYLFWLIVWVMRELSPLLQQKPRRQGGRDRASKKKRAAGRKSILSPEVLERANALLAEGWGVKKVAESLGVSKSTIYRTADCHRAIGVTREEKRLDALRFAAAKGRKGGRKPLLSEAQQEEVRRLASVEDLAKLAAMMRVSESTIRRCIKRK